MMQFYDSHIHTLYSFDGHDTADSLCRAAIEQGLSGIAITDHYDVDGMVEDYYRQYDAAAAEAAIMEVKEKYRGRLEVAYGLELGQPYAYPEVSKQLLSAHPFDFVLGSLHNLLHVPDFSYMKMGRMTERIRELLWRRTLDEYELLLDFSEKNGGAIHSLAHINYPQRYFRLEGVDIDMTNFYDRIAALYRRMIADGMALEVNTSGLRKGIGITLPGTDLLRLYRDCGGELITIGSDAHFQQDVGADIRGTYAMLRELGFRYAAFYIDGKAVMHPLG